MRVYVLVNDRAANPRFIARRGLALGLEIDSAYILFDTGPDPSVLSYNSNLARFPLELVDHLVLSHIHSPHIGGVDIVGWESPYIKAFIPYGSMETIGRILKRKFLNPVEVVSEIPLSNNVFVTKPFYGPPWEHFLVARDSVGDHVLFSGCFHPNISDVLNELVVARRLRISTIVGGLHLENAPAEHVEKVAWLLAERFKIKKAILLHCSGRLIGNILNNSYGIDVTYPGAGDVFEL
ncbi:MBL fold metallo-hydrolase [Thermogladius sp. 4427co]|uniref:MBL fold metallo-hydrolase n=1 Tax=Thermogladius sp. 4427co TaxID=3450718 RepID=UPI003F7A5998